MAPRPGFQRWLLSRSRADHLELDIDFDKFFKNCRIGPTIDTDIEGETGKFETPFRTNQIIVAIRARAMAVGEGDFHFPLNAVDRQFAADLQVLFAQRIKRFGNDRRGREFSAVEHRFAADEIIGIRIVRIDAGSIDGDVRMAQLRFLLAQAQLAIKSFDAAGNGDVENHPRGEP